MENAGKKRIVVGILVMGLAAGILPAPVHAEDTRIYARGPSQARGVSQTSYASNEPRSRRRNRWKTAWTATWVAFAVVNALDTHASAGRRELNPLLRDGQDRFSVRKAMLLKTAIGGGFFGLQLWMAKSNPDKNYYKTFTLATGAATAGLGAVAARNYRLDRPSPASEPVRPDYLQP